MCALLMHVCMFMRVCVRDLNSTHAGTLSCVFLRAWQRVFANARDVTVLACTHALVFESTTILYPRVEELVRLRSHTYLTPEQHGNVYYSLYRVYVCIIRYTECMCDQACVDACVYERARPCVRGQIYGARRRTTARGDFRCGRSHAIAKPLDSRRGVVAALAHYVSLTARLRRRRRRRDSSGPRRRRCEQATALVYSATKMPRPRFR